MEKDFQIFNNLYTLANIIYFKLFELHLSNQFSHMNSKVILMNIEPLLFFIVMIYIDPNVIIMSEDEFYSRSYNYSDNWTSIS